MRASLGDNAQKRRLLARVMNPFAQEGGRPSPRSGMEIWSVRSFIIAFVSVGLSLFACSGNDPVGFGYSCAERECSGRLVCMATPPGGAGCTRVCVTNADCAALGSLVTCESVPQSRTKACWLTSEAGRDGGSPRP